MPDHSSKVSIKRILQLIGMLIVFALSAWLVLKVYSHFARQAAINQAEAEQVGQPALPPNALSPKDDFYRMIQGGIQANDATGLSSMQLMAGGALHQAFRLYVKKEDVIARTQATINKGSWSFNPFAGRAFGGPYWNETIEWCIRLRMPPGEEKMYAYILGQLSNVGFSESIGLARLPDNVRLTPDNALSYINLDDKKELLIPIRTMWAGESAKQVSIREWYIWPEAKICPSVAKK
jgi:hypothetical protein